MEQALTLERSFLPRPRQAARSAALRYEVVAGRDLDSPTLECWREFQQTNPELASPCFSREFAQSVSAARTDVEVCLIRQGREVVGIFPFQRQWGGRAVPLGSIVSDYQGLICRQDLECDQR